MKTENRSRIDVSIRWMIRRDMEEAVEVLRDSYDDTSEDAYFFEYQLGG